MANFLSSVGNVSGLQLVSTTTSNSPLSVSSTVLVSNLNVQYLNGQPQSYYTNATNISSGTLATSYGGTGLNSLSQGYIPFGQGSYSSFGSSSNLFWNSSVGYLGIGTVSPQNAIDVVGNINGSSNLTISGNCGISNSLTVVSNCTVSNGLIVASNCTIGNNCGISNSLTVASNCGISNSLTIGSNCTINSNLIVASNSTISNSLAIGTSNILTFPTFYLGTSSTTTPYFAISDKAQSTYFSVSVSNTLPQISGNKNGMSFGYMNTYSSNQSGYTEYGRFQSNALYLSNLKVSNPVQNAIQFYFSSTYSTTSTWTPINSAATMTVVNSNFSSTVSGSNISNSITTLYSGYLYLNFVTNVYISGIVQTVFSQPFTMLVYKNTSNLVYNYSNQTFNGNQTGSIILQCASNDSFIVQCSGMSTASAYPGSCLTLQSL